MLPPWGTGTSKTHFFFSAEKETVFAIQRKRGVVGTSCASLASPFGERSSAPLCLLSPADPLRWAPPGAPYNYRDASANGTAARCFTQRTSTSPGHGHPWEEQGKAVVLSLRRLVLAHARRGCVTPLNGRRYGLIRRKCSAVGPRVPLLRRRTCAPCTGGVTT